MAKYLAFGQVDCDIIVLPDGSESELKVGGSGFFALTGMRAYTKDCALVTNFGENYAPAFNKWLSDNEVSNEYCPVITERIPLHIMRYTEFGKYENVNPVHDAEWLGYMHPKAQDLEKAVSDETVAVSLYQDDDKYQWIKLRELADKYNFKLMWEVNHRCRNAERILNTSKIPEMWSINSNEVEMVFGIPRTEDLEAIKLLQANTNELCFYRAGSKGAYAVTKDGAWFCPAIDPTGRGVDPMGCGNCSIGAAAYAFGSGHTPAETVVMANVASGLNAAQFGPVPVFTEEIMSLAAETVEKSMSLVEQVL